MNSNDAQEIDFLPQIIHTICLVQECIQAIQAM